MEVTTKGKLNKLNSSACLQDGFVARTTDYIAYRPRQSALALLDLDTKDIPDHVRSRIDALGSYRAGLFSVLPELQKAGLVVRHSTSAGLRRNDTGEALGGSDGRHVYVFISDGSDARRFLQCLHDRLWLAGYGWFTVSRAGQLLERSLVDRSVHSAERLVFEGTPVLEPPLAQDPASRVPRVTEGPPIDTCTVCGDLRLVEEVRLRDLKYQEKHRMSGEADKARGRYIEDYAQRTGCSRDVARHIVDRQHTGILLPDFVLPFDDDDLAGTKVGELYWLTQTASS